MDPKIAIEKAKKIYEQNDGSREADVSYELFYTQYLWFF